MLVDLTDFFYLSLVLCGFYICYRAGFEQAMSRILKELEEAGVIKFIDDEEEK